MLNFEQQVELAKELGGWHIEHSKLKVVDLLSKGVPAVYVYEEVRGGKQVIVGNDGKVLAFSSAINLDKVVDDIKNNNLWDKAVDLNMLKNSNCDVIEKYFAIENKIDPSWDKICQDIAVKLCKAMKDSGVKCVMKELADYSNYDDAKMEAEFAKYGVTLTQGKNTNISICNLFRRKASKIQKDLEK